MKKRTKAPTVAYRVFSRVLTLLAVIIAWCFFRTPDVASALAVLAGMAGRNGVTMVTEIDALGSIMLALAAITALSLPNTNELFLYRDSNLEKISTSPSLVRLNWSPNARWGLAIGLIFALCVLSIERTSDFIYAQF